MSSTPPDEPTGTPGTPPPSGPDYGAPPPSGPDYGAPPPPPPGYGTPPPSDPYGAPPPPPGDGYGSYGGGPYGGGPYGGGPYGGGPAAPDWSIGAALGYGWTKFTENVGQILLAALLLLVASLIAFGIGVPIRAAIDHNGSFFMSELASSITQIILTLLTWIVQAAIVRGALDITEGRRFEVGTLFSRLDIGNVLLASLLVSVITFVGTLLCVLPGIVAWFFLLFTPFFVVDQNLPAVEAIKASFNFTRANLANMLVWVIVGGIVYLVGYCFVCIGILVTAPVVIIGAAYTYKRLTGQPVAP